MQVESSPMIQEFLPNKEARVPNFIFMLSSSNYRVKVMRIEVHLEAHRLWEKILGIDTN